MSILNKAQEYASHLYGIHKSLDWLHTQFVNHKKDFWKVAPCTFIVARLFSQGLANFLALETLRHGTNPVSWASIHLIGALPSFGASSWGGDHGCGYGEQNRNRFYCAYQVSLNSIGQTHLTSLPFASYFAEKFSRNPDNPLVRIGSPIFKTFLTSYFTKTYTYSSSRNAGEIDSESAIHLACITPNIKFHISQERLLADFEADSSYPSNYAYSTNKRLYPINSGLPGIIWNSLTYKTPIRMYQQPKKVLSGMAQMGVALGVAALAYRMARPKELLQKHSWAALTGVGLALI